MVGGDSRGGGEEGDEEGGRELHVGVVRWVLGVKFGLMFRLMVELLRWRRRLVD